MLSNVKDGGTIINYSSRFTITGLVGQTTADLVTAAKQAGTTVPNTVNGAAPAAGAAGGGAAAAPAGGEFTVPYYLQTGLTKYAPMQPVPPTKITQQNVTPLFPTSAFSTATTWLPRPSVVLTTTASQTFSVSSVENTVSHLPVTPCDRNACTSC